jgi:ankyrin repeat protein
MLIAVAWSAPAFCSEIHDAAKSGDLAKVQALLKDNPDLVSSKDDRGSTPLHLAAASGHKDVAELLIAAKADVNARDDNGSTPLHSAVQEDHKDVAELLLASKADVNIRNYNGWTPLHTAAWKGHKDVAELLLANNADVNAKDYGDDTPLHTAASVGRLEVAEVLLANKADVNPQAGKRGVTPLDFASIGGHQNVVELLRQHGGLEGSALRTATPESALTVTLKGGGVCYPSERSGDISIKCNRGNVLSTFVVSTTPTLHLIDGRGPKDLGKGKALHGTIDTVQPGSFNSNWDRGFKIPLTAGRHTIDVSFFEGVGTMVSTSADLTVAFVAVSGHSYIVDALITSSVNPVTPTAWSPIVFDATDKAEQLVPVWSVPFGGNAIHEAAADGDLERVAALLKDSPGRVFSKDAGGDTPLHWAAQNDRKAVAELLLANNAKIDATNFDGWTPLGTAAMYGHKDLAEVLLANKADPNARNKSGSTALHAAAGFGHADIAELLLSNKADVDAMVNDRETPLHIAAVSGHANVAELLLANKANVNARTTEGVTPLHYAAGRGHVDVAESLLAHGADVNAVDNKGKTPLGYAKRVNKRLADLLRQHGGHE